MGGYTHSNDNPDQRTTCKDLNRKFDVGNSEHAPVETKDGSFGAEQGGRVEEFGNVEDESVLHEDFGFCSAIFDVVDMKTESFLDPYSKC